MADNFIKVMFNHLKVDEYVEFMSTPQYRVYMFLRCAIIRESAELVGIKNNKMTRGAGRIYSDYFRDKRKLVSTYSLKNLSKYLNISKANLSRYVNRLNDAGFIKINKRTTELGLANDYEFGYYDGKFGTESYKEHYYMDEHFDKLYEDRIENMKSDNTKEEYTINEYINEHKYVYEYLHIDDTWSGLDVMRAFTNKLDYITYKQCEMGRFLTDDEKNTFGDRWMFSHKARASVG